MSEANYQWYMDGEIEYQVDFGNGFKAVEPIVEGRAGVWFPTNHGEASVWMTEFVPVLFKDARRARVVIASINAPLMTSAYEPLSLTERLRAEFRSERVVTRPAVENQEAYVDDRIAILTTERESQEVVGTLESLGEVQITIKVPSINYESVMRTHCNATKNEEDFHRAINYVPDAVGKALFDHMTRNRLGREGKPIPVTLLEQIG